MAILTLLLGIAIAASLFAALLWSVYRIFTATERTIKLAHMALAILILVGMAAVSFNWTGLGIPLGIFTIMYAGIVIFIEKGRAFILPLIAGIFGGLLVLGLPFALT